MRGLLKPPPGYVLGVDTSRFQGHLNVVWLRRCGARFVIAKATDGEHTVDPQWAASALACSDAGIAWSAYGVLEPYGLARAHGQAQNFIRAVKGSGITFAPALDFELARGESAHDALVSAAMWCDEVEQALGCTVMVYTMPSFVEALGKFAGQAGEQAINALSNRPLWLAHYTGSFDMPPHVPEPWTKFTLWQASGGRPHGGRPGSSNYSTLPGTDTDVDVNLLRGTIENLPAGP